ncbi:hypothetical protein, partial [Streptomyces sp. NPDC004050]
MTPNPSAPGRRRTAGRAQRPDHRPDAADAGGGPAAARTGVLRTPHDPAEPRERAARAPLPGDGR